MKIADFRTGINGLESTTQIGPYDQQIVESYALLFEWHDGKRPVVKWSNRFLVGKSNQTALQGGGFFLNLASEDAFEPLGRVGHMNRHMTL